jgi:hypothetical protein
MMGLNLECLSPGSQATAVVPILVTSTVPLSSCQPVTVGIPLPKGLVTQSDTLFLRDQDGTIAPLQTAPLARWHDGSVKWLLVDFLNGAASQGESQWVLGKDRLGTVPPNAARLQVLESPQAIVVETGIATFHLGRNVLRPLDQVLLGGRPFLDSTGSNITLRDPKGRPGIARVERITIEDKGPVRATVRFDGVFTGSVPCRFVARMCFFAGLGLVRLGFTLHNPRRARHPGGLWDLGDTGSMLFRDLSLQVALSDASQTSMTWQAEPGLPCRSGEASSLEIYEDSSGGEKWRSASHLNRHGQVPCKYRGYRSRHGGREEMGLRASPVVSLQAAGGSVTVAFPEFWQQFPKAMECDGRSLRVRLFPEQFGDLFELQGGEQKTHTVWLDFDQRSRLPELPLSWVHQPARAQVSPEWTASTGAVVPFALPNSREGAPLDTLLQGAACGSASLFARRESIDEYGWRNFGEVYADHEAAHYEGPLPVISHYNNQYDVIYGTLLQYLNTGKKEWLDLCGPLARHVIDIDIYHTDRDKAAYNGGLFWFTDHYKTAATCTHRTYSRANCRPGDRSYGGGPSSAHNFTTGLLHFYYVTGDLNARAAVVGLADWVLAMDDGRQNVLGWVDDGPTGLASCTFELDYQGPGRGCGNSINALLDAWLVTGSRSYLDNADLLIRRCIHPADDIAARDLLNVELRWSYPVFLSALARYLRLKAECEDLDFTYAYTQASLLHYAEWMVENEVPYFDHPEKLEFPTEVWAAQELRKGNVLRLAAAHADEPMRTRLMRRGLELAHRGWSDLERFESRNVARALAIVMVEGVQDLSLRVQEVSPAPRPVKHYDFGSPEVFIPQKLRVAAQLKSVRGWCRIALRLLNPANWPVRNRRLP